MGAVKKENGRESTADESPQRLLHLYNFVACAPDYERSAGRPYRRLLYGVEPASLHKWRRRRFEGWIFAPRRPVWGGPRLRQIQPLRATQRDHRQPDIEGYPGAVCQR